MHGSSLGSATSFHSISMAPCSSFASPPALQPFTLPPHLLNRNRAETNANSISSINTIKKCQFHTLGQHQHYGRLLASLPLKSTNANVNFDTVDNAATTNTKSTKPSLATFLEKFFQRIIQFFFFRKCSSFTIDIGASSNGALLKGDIDNFSLSARNCEFRFNLLSLERCDLSGKDMRLGYVPLLLPLFPLLLWKLRRSLWSMMFCLLLMRQTQTGQQSSLPGLLQSTKEQLWHKLGARSSALNFSIRMNQRDIIERSAVMKFWLRGILRSLVENSVVGAAAAFGDAQSAIMEDVKRQTAGQRGVGNNAPLLLPGTGNRDGSSNALANAISQGGKQDQGLNSKLLSATSFELKDVSFSNGRIIFDAEGIMPPKENANDKQTHLPFTIRAKLEPTTHTIVDADGQQQQTTTELQRKQSKQSYNNAIGILNPECRMNTKPLLPGGSKSLLGKLLPDVIWLPFGVGVAVPLGKRCRLYRVDATGGGKEKDGRGDGGGSEGGSCRMDGSIALFRRQKSGLMISNGSKNDGSLAISR